MDQAAHLFDIRLFSLGGTTVTAATLISLVVVFLATYWISRLAQRALARLLPVVGVDDHGSVAASGRLVHYTVMALGLAVVLQTLGIDLSALFAAGALFAVGIGFAARNIVENFSSGLILLTERAIKPGDILQVEGRVVRVSKMGIRATIVRTRDEEDMILPNALLAQGAVTNYTLRDTLYRLRTQVGVSYGSDMKRVHETLMQAARDAGFGDPERDPVVLLKQFGSSSVDFDVSVWVQDPWATQSDRAQLNAAIWWALKAADITIAFPQVDVHFDALVPEALELRSV